MKNPRPSCLRSNAPFLSLSLSNHFVTIIPYLIPIPSHDPPCLTAAIKHDEIIRDDNGSVRMGTRPRN